MGVVSMANIPMTVAGEAALRAELDVLKKTERPRIIQAIAEARAHGDLKENAEYHAAREQQGFVEGRIKEIEGKLSQVQVIDITTIPKADRVIFGATVPIVNVDTDQTLRYKIVGDDEADVKVGKVSYQSPVARALIGKQVDDVAVVKTPAGVVEYEITNVEYQ